MHGGSVQALSAGLNQGSRFVVRLPLSTGLADIKQWQIAAPTLSSRCRTLLVDDNRDDHRHRHARNGRLRGGAPHSGAPAVVKPADLDHLQRLLHAEQP